MTYGCETWKLTKQIENLLRIAQTAMGRAVLGITLRDRKRSTWIREKTRVKDYTGDQTTEMEVGRTCS